MALASPVVSARIVRINLAVVGGVAGVVAVVGSVLAAIGVVGSGVPVLALIIAAICGLLFTRTVTN